jgi:multisubunit Na+/H+ antiporter MnhG subunit
VISFSVIAGVDPKVSLIASVVLCLAMSFLGGRPAMVTAAAGSVALVIGPMVHQHGVQYILPAVILAGVIQILFGALGMARLMRFIPAAVMTGFVNALGILIFFAQVPHFWNKSPLIWGLFALTLFIVQWTPRVIKSIPAPLIAVVALTLFTATSGQPLPTVGDEGSMSGGLPGLTPLLAPLTLQTLMIIWPCALSIAFVGLMESLLTARLVDDLTATPSNKNRESAGLGIANMLAGFYGGIAGCAMIGQTIVNVEMGKGRSRVSTFARRRRAAAVGDRPERGDGEDPDGGAGGHYGVSGGEDLQLAQRAARLAYQNADRRNADNAGHRGGDGLHRQPGDRRSRRGPRDGAASSPRQRQASGYSRNSVARPRKIKKPPVSVMAVIITLEPTAGSRPSFTIVIGISTPISAATSRFSTIARVITPPSARVLIQPPCHAAHDAAPDQAVHQRHAHFTQDKKRQVARLDFLQRQGAHDHGDGLIAGVAADARHDGHQRRQRHQPGDGMLEAVDHPRGDKRGAQVNGQPRPAGFHRFRHRGEHVLFGAQAPHPPQVAVGLFVNHVNDIVNG